MDYLITEFAAESDMIEGEDFNEDHLESLRIILYADDKLTPELLLQAHKAFAPEEDWSGKYRDCNVWIGGSSAPSYHIVPDLMSNWFLDLPTMDSYEAHIRFEKIHPFRDGNGRLGRAIWLKMLLREGREPKSFLQEFYYQTLAHAK